MKKYLLIFSLFFFISCLPVEEDEFIQIRRWNASGVAQFTSDATTDADVKMALFYVNSTSLPTSLSTSYTLASSVINLGRTSGQSKDFTLSIDCTKVTPSDGQFLGVFMWRDSSKQDTFTSSDKSCLVKYSLASGNFDDGSSEQDFLYKYVGYNGDVSADAGLNKGWNQQYGATKYRNINKLASKLSGAYSIPNVIIKGSL